MATFSTSFRRTSGAADVAKQGIDYLQHCIHITAAHHRYLQVSRRSTQTQQHSCSTGASDFSCQFPTRRREIRSRPGSGTNVGCNVFESHRRGKPALRRGWHNPCSGKAAAKNSICIIGAIGISPTTGGGCRYLAAQAASSMPEPLEAFLFPQR